MTGRLGPRITFGIIVLNGEPFTRYALRALYPFAHEIIVAEGAAPAARSISTDDGHSQDGTIEVLREFIRLEDPDSKVTMVTAEDEGHANGFWPGEKDEQSRAYTKRATGDYIWQIDIDEFYLPGHMRAIFDYLAEHPDTDGISFDQVTFWGGLDYITDGWYLRCCANQVRRVFRWGPGFRYVTHRPPTIQDAQGRDLHGRKWIHSESMLRMGVRMLHYSLLLPKQVAEKCDYYAKAAWAHRGGATRWAKETYGELAHPFRVHNVYDYPSWLDRYLGVHPPEIVRMWEDLETSTTYELRRTDDIEDLLSNPSYRLGRTLLKAATPIHRPLMRLEHRAKRVVGRG